MLVGVFKFQVEFILQITSSEALKKFFQIRMLHI